MMELVQCIIIANIYSIMQIVITWAFDLTKSNTYH